VLFVVSIKGAGMSQDAQQPQRAAISISVTRADGTVEDLGVVSYQSKNKLEELAFKARKALGLRVDTTELFTPDQPHEGA
jgi:16S rRNA C1402 N4-methylase RsmH